MIKDNLSPTAISNLFTMGVTQFKDPRQAIPGHLCTPRVEDRRLRARLILEEALETIKALGFDLYTQGGEYKVDEVDSFESHTGPEPDFEKIIDGCCDTIYVCTGTLLKCGMPDVPALAEVCARNDAKFPGAVALTDANGKFQKPEGWLPPNWPRIFTQVGIPGLDFVSHEILRIKKNGSANGASV